MFSVAGWPVWGLIALFIVGLALIVKGGDFFVDAAGWIAEVSGIPRFIVGATIVSFATTLPELIVSCIGAARGTNALAIGNAVGSVTANTGLIMAISIICIPAVIKRSQYALKSILLLAATTILYLASFGKGFSLWGSILLLLIFAVAMIDNVRGAKKESVACEKMPLVKKEIPINVAKFILGAAGIVFGAEFLVDSATELAVVSGVSQAVISATIVAIGTSLPELVTTVTAIVKKQVVSVRRKHYRRQSHRYHDYPSHLFLYLRRRPGLQRAEPLSRYSRLPRTAGDCDCAHADQKEIF